MKETDRHIILRLRELTDRYYDGTASVAEERELLDTLRKYSGTLPADLEEEYRVLKGIDPSAPASDDAAAFCSDIIDGIAREERIKRRRPFRRLLKITAAAAAITVLIAVGVSLNKGDSEPERTMTASTETPAPAPAPAPAAPEETPVMIAKAEKPLATPTLPRRQTVTGTTVSDTVVMAREITDSAEAVSRIEAALALISDKFDKASRAAEVSKELIDNTKETIKTHLRYEETI